jgi:hypothetical protein
MGTSPELTPDVSEYCRQIETYLCRKNEGHLIRIVGPAFEQVSGWAVRGVPLSVAYRGIDQYCERYYAKGPRRRPVRIEFCEADILDLFDAWRRAVGVAPAGAAPEVTRRPSLASHIDRVIARLTALRLAERSAGFVREVDAAVTDLDAVRAETHHARGDRRTALVARLDEIDRRLMAAAAAEIPSGEAARLRGDAETELAPFAGRMPAEARTAASEAGFLRLVRETLGLPVIRFE